MSDTPLRPECTDAPSGTSISRERALLLIRAAVARRRSLIHGSLHLEDKHCALGCFWEDNPGTALEASLVNEISAMNDATPRATPKQRWKRMYRWLRILTEIKP